VSAMPGGEQGDHPITKMLVHGLHPFPPDVEGMLREILALDPEFPGGGRPYAEQVEWETRFFAWEQGQRLDEGRDALRSLLDELRRRRSELAEFVAHYVAQLDGAKSGDAIQSLTERREALPLLVEAYERESDDVRRRMLLHCIWQFRIAASMPALATAASDSDPRVWKEALDGIVTLGGRAALSALERARETAERGGDVERVRWIDEAIGQVREAGA